MMNENTLIHYGVLGMKWGVRRYQNKDGSLTSAGRMRDSLKQKTIETAYGVGAKIRPREAQYKVKRFVNRASADDIYRTKTEELMSRNVGTLTTNEKTLKAIEKVGIEKHKATVYNNLTDSDISNFKKYTDAAIYSRAVNGYLATGSPAEIAEKAAALKASLSKNKIDDQVVYRSCNLKFTTSGLEKKLDTYSTEELSNIFDQMSGQFKGKSFGENRVYSTSTSPLFAIDTWRKVNPTAAKTYNSYLIIDCKGTPGVFADAKTSSGKRLVNTGSNQEVILAPNKMTYKKMTWDADRGMFAIYLEAK